MRFSLLILDETDANHFRKSNKVYYCRLGLNKVMPFNLSNHLNNILSVCACQVPRPQKLRLAVNSVISLKPEVSSYDTVKA